MSETAPLSIYINAASKQVRRNLDAIFYEYEYLTGIQGCMLGVIADAQRSGTPFYQKDLERRFHIRRSSVNSLICALEEKGYIQRTQVKGDARLKQLSLTEKGQEASKAIGQSLAAYDEQLASIYTEEEQETLIHLLQRILPDEKPDIPPRIGFGKD